VSLDLGASAEDIARAHRSLRRGLHPDQGGRCISRLKSTGLKEWQASVGHVSPSGDNRHQNRGWSLTDGSEITYCGFRVGVLPYGRVMKPKA
jgi:hypothetical protein